MAELLAATLFGVGYLAITLEHKLFVNKAATSLVLAALLWLLVSMVLPGADVHHYLEIAGADIFSLVIFLLTAMTLVEILLHYHFFDIVDSWLRNKNFSYRQLGWAVVGLSFIFSSWLDNLTATIVALQICRRLFPPAHLLPMAALVVIATNAGGAFSPIGDITTLMLWFAGKFSAGEIISQGILPSVTLIVIASLFILRKLPTTICACKEDDGWRGPSRSDKIIIGAALGSFTLPLGTALVGLPPYLGLLAGLGGVWLLIDTAKKTRPQKTHLEANIRNFLQQTDLESIQFFVGILLAVSALHALGLLESLTHALLGAAPSFMHLVGVFSGLGIASAIIDNVPLTAAAISALPPLEPSLWVLLALTVGTGGSLLIIGSAAGIIAMGMVPELTFMKYLKVGTLPALAGFTAAIGVWLLQTSILG